MLNVNCKIQNMKYMIELQNTSVKFEISNIKYKFPKCKT